MTRCLVTDSVRRFTPIIAAAALLAARPAGAQITPGQGLTADEAVRLALASSHTLEASREEIEAARAATATAEAGYVPRLTGTARYTRLSDLGTQSLGSIVVVPPGTADGPLAAGTPLINHTLSFSPILDNYTLSANLAIPVSDYFLRVAPSV